MVVSFILLPQSLWPSHLCCHEWRRVAEGVVQRPVVHQASRIPQRSIARRLQAGKGGSDVNGSTQGSTKRRSLARHNSGSSGDLGNRTRRLLAEPDVATPKARLPACPLYLMVYSSTIHRICS